MGDNFITDLEDYDALTGEEKAEEQKALRALGYYRGPYGGYHSGGSWPPTRFCHFRLAPHHSARPIHPSKHRRQGWLQQPTQALLYI